MHGRRAIAAVVKLQRDLTSTRGAGDADVDWLLQLLMLLLPSPGGVHLADMVIVKVGVERVLTLIVGGEAVGLDAPPRAWHWFTKRVNIVLELLHQLLLRQEVASTHPPCLELWRRGVVTTHPPRLRRGVVTVVPPRPPLLHRGRGIHVASSRTTLEIRTFADLRAGSAVPLGPAPPTRIHFLPSWSGSSTVIMGNIPRIAVIVAQLVPEPFGLEVVMSV